MAAIYERRIRRPWRLFRRVLYRCPGDSLEGAQLSHQALRWVGIYGERMDKASFVETDMAWSALESVSLQGADFARAHLHRSSFKRCQIDNASFERADVAMVLFEHCSLAGAKFHRATLHATQMSSCHAPGADFSYADFETPGIGSPVRFRSCNLREVSFIGARFNSCHFIGCDLTGCDFSKAYFTYPCKFIKCDLRGADLSSARFLPVCDKEVYRSTKDWDKRVILSWTKEMSLVESITDESTKWP